MVTTYRTASARPVKRWAERTFRIVSVRTVRRWAGLITLIVFVRCAEKWVGITIHTVIAQNAQRVGEYLMSRHYVLLDACVPAAHYAQKSTQNVTLLERATSLLTGKSPDVDIRFLIPNFCIAEVFSVFEKYRWGRTWNKHVKIGNMLNSAEFKAARRDFSEAIHNGSKILQLELDRYHILCVDLVSPINNAYKINRNRGSKAARERAKRVNPASTYDMLVAAMGIWLAQQHGPENFTVVTGDERLTDVLARARSAKRSVPMRAHLTHIAARLGLKYSAEIYPHVIDLAHAKKADLRARFPNWEPAW